MKLLAIAVSLFAVAAPSKTVRLAIIHTVHGCHVWQTTRSLGAAGVLKVTAGTKVVLRVNCPMDFTLTQVRGPKLALGDPTMHTGTTAAVRAWMRRRSKNDRDTKAMDQPQVLATAMPVAP